MRFLLPVPKNNAGTTNCIPEFYFPDPNMISSRLVHGYDEEGKNTTRNSDVSNVNPSWGGPAGGLISNSHDVAMWANALFSGKILTEKGLIEMKNLVSMQTGQSIKNNLEGGYGMGIASDFESAGLNKKYCRVYDHSGGMLGYRSYFVYFSCYSCFIALTTNTNRDINLTKIASDIMDIIVKSDEWKKFKKVHATNPINCNPFPIGLK